MIGTNKENAYNDAKKCLDQLLANDQIPFYGYVEIMLQLDTMMADSYGKWISQTNLDGFTYWKCSKCGKKNYYDITDFCCRCGAKMEVNKDE